VLEIRLLEVELQPAENDYESFDLRFMGLHFLAGNRCTPAEVTQAIDDVLASRKRLKVSTSSFFDFQVHGAGIRMVPKGSTRKRSSRKVKKALKKASAAEHELALPATFYPQKWLVGAAYHNANPQLFAFATIVPSSGKFQCHVFQFGRSSVPIVNAICRGLGQ